MHYAGGAAPEFSIPSDLSEYEQERLRNRNGSKESEAGGTLQLVVAVGATMRVLLKSSKPCVTGEELIPPDFSESLYSEPRCH